MYISGERGLKMAEELAGPDLVDILVCERSLIVASNSELSDMFGIFYCEKMGFEGWVEE